MALCHRSILVPEKPSVSCQVLAVVINSSVTLLNRTLTRKSLARRRSRRLQPSSRHGRRPTGTLVSQPDTAGNAFAGAPESTQPRGGSAPGLGSPARCHRAPFRLPPCRVPRAGPGLPAADSSERQEAAQALGNEAVSAAGCGFCNLLRASTGGAPMMPCCLQNFSQASSAHPRNPTSLSAAGALQNSARCTSRAPPPHGNSTAISPSGQILWPT